MLIKSYSIRKANQSPVQSDNRKKQCRRGAKVWESAPPSNSIQLKASQRCHGGKPPPQENTRAHTQGSHSQLCPALVSTRSRKTKTSKQVWLTTLVAPFNKSMANHIAPFISLYIAAVPRFQYALVGALYYYSCKILTCIFTDPTQILLLGVRLVNSTL